MLKLIKDCLLYQSSTYELSCFNTLGTFKKLYVISTLSLKRNININKFTCRFNKLVKINKKQLKKLLKHLSKVYSREYTYKTNDNIEDFYRYLLKEDYFNALMCLLTVKECINSVGYKSPINHMINRTFKLK